jgi:acyl-[acyl-carrier-protein]-phospholipid O-acyltransferase/long-chain-fatty-acid--[acyl-carrier-protein] ligase
LPDDKLKEVIEKLGKAGLPNLWVPKSNQFYHVEDFPMLGTGKLDLRKVRDVAVEMSKGAPELPQEA